MRYRILGSIEVDDGDSDRRSTVAVGGPQQRRLLGALLTYPDRVVSTDRLVDVLWPDTEPPPGAHRSVLTYVSRLRAALGPASIINQDNGYRLDPAIVDRDVDAFEGLINEAERSLPDRAVACYDDALALWRGRPFGEFGDEWWAVAESTRLEEMYVAARERRAALLVSIGHHHRAIPDLEALIVEYPLRERPASLLVQSLHASGRTAEALRVARAFHASLGDETGLEPTAEFLALEASIAGGTANEVETRGAAPLRGYTLGEPIGEGCSGRVYAATQPGTGRRVAIKVVRPDLADSSDFIRRFEAEARLVAGLEHPHIVPLYDYWREPGGAYLVFRLLSGGTARDSLITGGAWSLERVDRVVEDIGAALMTAHALGVHHNDVSTANILLDDAGAAYLTDFGIATVDDATTESSDAAQRDVCGLAWMIWELLASFDDQASGTARRHPRAVGPPSLIGRVPELPAQIDAVLAAATAAEGGYTSVAELILGWRAAVGHELRTTTTPHRVNEPSSSRRRAADAMTRSIVAGINPYKGLRPFEETDTAVYFGRRGAVDELAAMVDAHRLVTVVGPSGSGKSSLVRAGLVPVLRSQGHAIATMVPGSEPTVALRDALIAVSPTQLRGRDTISNLRAVGRRVGPLVLVVDQFEEAWTIAPEQGRAEFVATLAAAVADNRIDLRVITTIRADRFDLPLQDPTIGPSIGAGAYAVGPMCAAQLSDAILGPARRAGVDVDDGVVADLVAAAAVAPGTLPMLQFTLAELYESRRDGLIGGDALERLGGMTGVIGRRAEAVFATLKPHDRLASRHLLCWLVIIGSDGVAARRRAPISDLWPDARTVADDFVAARLLVVDRHPASREPTVEIAHEALMVRWPRFAAWIAEDREWLAQLRHLTESASAWQLSDHDPSDLYRGARLEAALEAIDDGRVVAASERDFLGAGRRLRDADVVEAQHSARRLRRLLAGTALTLLVALVAGSLALVQRQRADDAAAAAIAEAIRADVAADDARTETERADNAARTAMAAERAASIEALVGRSESIRTTQRAPAALLAVEAYGMADTATTRSALFSTFTNDQGFLDAHVVDQTPAQPGVVMPDGETAFIGGQDGRIRPYDLDTGELGEPLPALADDVRPYALLRPSPDGRYLAQIAEADADGVGDAEAIAGIYDLQTGSVVFDPVRFGGTFGLGEFESATFGPDGRYLFITRVLDNEVLAIDAQTGDTKIALAGTGLSPDGDLPWQGGGVAAVSNNRVVVGARTGEVTIFDSSTFDVVATLTAPPNTATTLRTVSDGTRVVGAGPDGVFLLDVDSATIVWQDLDFAESCALYTVIAERNAIYCADYFGRLVERDLTTGAFRRALEAQNGHPGQLWSARGGRELVSFGGEVPVVSRWRLDGSGPISRAIAPGWEVTSFSGDGRMLLVAHTEERGAVVDDGSFSFKVIDATTGADIALVPPDFGPVTFAGDGRLIGGYSLPDGTVRPALLDLVTGERADIDIVLPGPADDLAFEPAKDTTLAMYWNDDFTGTEIWNVSAEGLVGPVLQTGPTYWMSASRDGLRIARVTDGGVAVHDARTGDIVGTIDAPDAGAVFITLDDRLVLAANDGELTLYSLDDLQPLRTFAGSGGRVEELYSSADGSVIAARGGDRLVTLFDTATGTALGKPISIPNDEANVISLSPDGRALAVGGGGTAAIKIWDLDPDSWVDAVCRLAGRNLTRTEWDSYIGDLSPYAATCAQFPLV